MGSELSRDYSRGLTGRDAWKVSKEASRYQAASRATMAAIDAHTDEVMAAIDSGVTVDGFAMSQVFKLAQLRKQLELAAPELAGELAFIAQMNMLSITEISQAHAKNLRRAIS